MTSGASSKTRFLLASSTRLRRTRKIEAASGERVALFGGQEPVDDANTVNAGVILYLVLHCENAEAT